MATSPLTPVFYQLRRMALRDGAGLADGQLLESFITRKDEAAFETLVRRHGPMVLGVCRRVLRNHHDAEDALQATFLVLARKADSVVPRELVANWLYGVAYRTALKARTITARRCVRERQVAEMPEPEAVEPDNLWRELQPLLDEELRCLPDKYRVPVVLCDLQCLTGKEAARQLGCPEGTVASRLSRGRTLLRKRLVRRGLIVASGSLASLLSQQAADAALPSSLVSSIVKAATTGAAGAAAGISAKVAALTEGVVKAMFASQLKKISTVLFAMAVLWAAGAGWLYWTQAGAQEEGAKAAEGKESSELPQDSHQAPARKEIGRILLSAELRIMDGEEAKEKRPNRILLIDPESGEWKDLSIAPARYARDPRLSPDGKTIAFGNWAGVFPGRASAEQSIWTCDGNGGNLKQIFDKGSKAIWSADGKHLIVTKETLDGKDWKFKAWQIDPDGSNATELPLPATDCAIESSPDGRWITTISGRPQSFPVNGFQIYIMRPDATNERLLTQGGANIDPRFSPDSKKVLYTGNERGNYKAWTVEIQGGKRTEIYHQEKPEFGVPVSACWSPDGKRIAMVVHDWERTEDGKLVLSDPEKGNYRIMIMDAQGQNSQQLKLKNARLVGGDTLEWR